ncbi:MAG: glycoside hydrolase family 38 C-terminal domain-containing protein [Candidatus Methylacidiphilales bacterium]|nr:glycoside hydrolase family 38 C-terminal domain-containing protein [Candidatus Methylacidiphilales bacterium]
MLPSNPLLQLTYPRVKSAEKRLQKLIWTKVADLTLAYAGNTRDHQNVTITPKLKFKPITLPFTWGKLFDQGWFQISLPKELPPARTPLYLHWNDQGEGTLHIDGIPYYGFDVAHRYCRLPDSVRGKKLLVESLALQSAIWHPSATGMSDQGSVLSEAALYNRDDLAWKVWHDFVVLIDLLEEEMKTNFPQTKPTAWGVGFQPATENLTPFYRRLLRLLDDAVNAFDSGGLKALDRALTTTYASFRGQGLPITATLTGHAHIDLVWLWPERAGEYKAVHTFSTMNRLMDLYPEFRFGYSQPASYAAVERRSPALMKQVKSRIARKTWEPVGATEVESDTLLACGEALARSFLVGQEHYRQIQGQRSRVLWIPDVFGYSGCLPQIMRQTGVDYFFTTKLTWSNINKFPYSSFLWRGIDGSEVLVHVTQDNGYNQAVSTKEVKTGALAYRQSDVHDEYLCPTGYGDGGGGVTEEMCERARRLADIASMPKVRWGRIDEFFDRLNECRDKLPAYQGELYLEYHRGILTTHGNLKAVFRGAERALQVWEAVRCATGGRAIDPRAWERVIFAQFHDYIPGSSIAEVYEEGLAELSRITHTCLTTSTRELGKKMGTKGGSSCLFNPLPYTRTHLLRSGKTPYTVVLPPLSGAAPGNLARRETRVPLEASAQYLRSERVEARFDPQGQITRLVVDGREIAQRGPLNSLAVYPDQPHLFDAWEIDRQSLSNGKKVNAKAKLIDVVVSGDEATVIFERAVSSKSRVTICYRLEAHLPVLHVQYDFDWQDPSKLVKALFPTAYYGQNVRYGAPFGSVLRGQHPGKPRDEAQFEVAGSRYAAVSDDSELQGLAVITESKYGFSCREGVLGVSLLRSALITGEDPGHARLFKASIRRPVKTDTHSDLGPQTIRLALGFHSLLNPREESAAALADILFTPPIAYRGGNISSPFLGLEGGASLLPTWAKPIDARSWILRLNEVSGQRGIADIRLAPGWTALPVNLSEEPTQGNRPVTRISFKPYELLSLKIFRKKG